MAQFSPPQLPAIVLPSGHYQVIGFGPRILPGPGVAGRVLLVLTNGDSVDVLGHEAAEAVRQIEAMGYQVPVAP